MVLAGISTDFNRSSWNVRTRRLEFWSPWVYKGVEIGKFSEKCLLDQTLRGCKFLPTLEPSILSLSKTIFPSIFRIRPIYRLHMDFIKSIIWILIVRPNTFQLFWSENEISGFKIFSLILKFCVDIEFNLKLCQWKRFGYLFLTMNEKNICMKVHMYFDTFGFPIHIWTFKR
jgi:hypothetical protein